MSNARVTITLDDRTIVDHTMEIDFGRRDVSFQVWKFLKQSEGAHHRLCVQDFITAHELNEKANTVEYLQPTVDLLGARCTCCYQGTMEDDDNDMVMCSECGIRRRRYPHN